MRSDRCAVLACPRLESFALFDGWSDGVSELAAKRLTAEALPCVRSLSVELNFAPGNQKQAARARQLLLRVSEFTALESLRIKGSELSRVQAEQLASACAALSHLHTLDLSQGYSFDCIHFPDVALHLPSLTSLRIQQLGVIFAIRAPSLRSVCLSLSFRDDKADHWLRRALHVEGTASPDGNRHQPHAPVRSPCPRSRQHASLILRAARSAALATIAQAGVWREGRLPSPCREHSSHIRCLLWMS